VRVGHAIALGLAREGADVAIGYRRSAVAARHTVDELRALGVRAVALRGDLGRPAEATRLAARTVEQLGRLDVLINNAAIFPRTPFASTTPAQFDHVMAVNLRAPFFCAQGAARVMAKRGGRIINIADVAAVRTWPGYIPYAITKAGLLTLTKSLAAALAPGIQVNAVAPGMVLPSEGFPRATARRLAARVPMRRRGRPADVVAAVCFFATCPEFVTGQVLFVDGGASVASC
jgi:NAD(P)-dependent dehydrogenase (short-subunit alcohol dehydrogenase family)